MSLIDVQPVGLCLDCNYTLLRGLREPRCPECGRAFGRAFDPDDPATMNLGRPLTPAARFVLGPVRWRVAAVVLAAAICTFWLARLPRVGRAELAIHTFIWSALALVWLAWPLLRDLVARRNGWQLSLLTAGRRSRVWVGAIVVAMLIAMWREVPMRLSLLLSRRSMDQLATEMMKQRKLAPRDQWLGVYRATSIRCVPGGMRFVVRRGDGFEAGFIYLPDVQQSNAFSTYRPVGGGWWTWWEEVP